MKRFLCLYFPRWAIQCLRQRKPETRGTPVVVFKNSAHGPLLDSCSVEAGKLGVRSRMPLAEATALAPGLIVHEADPHADQKALEKVGLWAGQFSPWVAVEPEYSAASYPQSLLLDISGCAQVFKGEHNLLSQAVLALEKRGFKARAAIAPTIGAAWALAHYGRNSAIVSDDLTELRLAISALSLSGLRLDPEVLICLNKLGLHRVGHLLKQPLSTLPSRFGTHLIERLDQILGIVPESLVWLRPPPEIVVSRAFEYPLKDAGILLRILDRMIAELAMQLKKRNRGARQINCWLYPEISDPICVDLTLFKGSASSKHLKRLLRTRLEQLPRFLMHALSQSLDESVLEPAYGIRAVSLWVTATETLEIGQDKLFARASPNEKLMQTIEHIVSRLGPSSVLHACLKADAQPEDAYVLTPFQEGTKEASYAPRDSHCMRPLQLLAKPEPITVDCDEANQLRAFCFQREYITIGHVIGPERIETGWWKESCKQRDFYVVDSTSGNRYWIFQTRDKGAWFLHGLFD